MGGGGQGSERQGRLIGPQTSTESRTEMKLHWSPKSPFVRKVMIAAHELGLVDRIQLVRSVAGRSGGFELDRSAAGITLADVYQAVEDDAVFRMHKTDPNSGCPIASQMKSILMSPFRAAESALSCSLAKTTLQDVAEAIH